MDGATLLNLLAISISVIAVVASMWFGARQVQIARQANYIPALMDLLAEFRSAELHEQYAYVLRDLNREHAPDGGLRGLSPAAKTAVYSVAYFFQTLAGLYALGVIDETAAIVMARARITKVWEAIAPFVERERQFPDVDPNLLSLLQAYAGVSQRFNGPSNEELIWARWHERRSPLRHRLFGRRGPWPR
ncbi:hypothetical protein ACFXAW_32570 [Streptomyces sp. NPDC059445]|uniref:DUF4760 domain-containing protein n=1 Tax=unclassified Streptomyces TaxID=2593676 RepID=UPI0036BDC68F